MSFGAWLKESREFHGLTLDEVAAKATTSKSYVWELENDRCDPTLSMAGKIAAVFGMELWRVLKKIDAALAQKGGGNG